MKSKEKLYLDIAKACLAAINETTGAPPKDAYEKVYAAIDRAMQEQFGPIIRSYERAEKALKTISELDRQEIDKARDIALSALQVQH
ncbi:MAG: hypothetical protein CSB48_08380 [Proteobacteria bacterium]|nr:MAG: hypothetical protein CSB48_08380 [Pseudomonadota bacterium]